MTDRIKAADGKELYLYRWGNVENPKGMIQIFHGMAEHAGRYAQLAEYLNSQGYIVYAGDHRGHGKTEECEENLGYIGRDGFNAIVEDKHLIQEHMQLKYPQLPMLILGHSFGSFVAQEYILRYGKELKGAILCGSAAQKGALVMTGRAISSVEKTLFGEKKPDKLLDSLSFGSYNKRIRDKEHKFAWLNTQENEVRKYEEDPFCGMVCTIGFYYYMFKGLSKLYDKERLDEIPKNLPIYIISGEEDPVGGYGRLVKELYEIYKKAGVSNVNIKLYPGARHELLLEADKEEVYKELLGWLDHAVV